MTSRPCLAEPIAYGPARKPSAPAQPEEVLIADARADLTPADMVERKLVDLLKRTPLAISCRGMDVPRDRGRTQSSAPRFGSWRADIPRFETKEANDGDYQ